MSFYGPGRTIQDMTRARRHLGLLSAGFFFLAAAVFLSAAAASLPPMPERPYPGPDTAAWVRPLPIHAPALATPATSGGPAGEGPTEGEVYLGTLAPEVREILLRDGVYLIQGEDPDSPSAKGGAPAAAIKGYIRALALFRQPKERTLSLMLEPGKLAWFLEDLHGSRTVARVPDVGELTKFTVKFLWIDVSFWVQHWFYPEISRYEWYMDTVNFKNDIRDNRGYWQLYALDGGRTVGEYGIVVHTGIPIPRSWFERIQRRRIPGAMEQFQRYIDSGGVYRKPKWRGE